MDFRRYRFNLFLWLNKPDVSLLSFLRKTKKKQDLKVIFDGTLNLNESIYNISLNIIIYFFKVMQYSRNFKNSTKTLQNTLSEFTTQ